MNGRRLFVLVGLLVGSAVAPALGQSIARFSGSGGTFTPGAPIPVAFQAQAPTGAEAAVFALSLDDVIAFQRSRDQRQLAEQLVRGRRPLEVARTRLVRPEPSPSPSPRFAPPYQPAVATARLGGLSPGSYLVRASGEGTETVFDLITVSSFGVVMTETGDRLVLYAVDLRTDQRRNDVTFERRRTGAAPEAGIADATGATTFPLPAPQPENPQDLFVARAPDGSTVVTTGARTFRAVVEKAGFVQTDRPIYRPGDVVHYRAILRDGEAGAFTIPTGERTVRVHDARNKTVLDVKRPVDAFGTVSGDLALSPDAALGTYYVDGGDDASGVGGSFAVEAYQKPEYVVDLAAPPTTVGGDTARIGVAARYFFGRPVAGMRLHYRAYLDSVNVWWRNSSPFAFSGYVPYRGDQLTPPVEGDALADAAGRATIRIPTVAVTSEKVLRVEVDGRDAAGRTVTASARAQVTPASFFLTVVAARYFNRVGETVEVALRSIVYGSNAPRPRTPISVTFTRVWYGSGNVQREADPAGPHQAVTDERGAANVRWKPAQGGYYEIAATTADERGRAVVTRSGVWIASDTYANPYEFTRTTVVPQQREYRPGERATLLVTAPQGNVDALVHVTGGGADQVFLRHLDTATSTIAIDPPSGVASYRVSVAVPTASGLIEGSAVVAISPAPHTLRVAVRGEKAKYAPGDRARFSVHVEGPDGKPARAEVGLAVVDDAIFALRQDRAVDPYRALYGNAGPFRSQVSSWNRLNAPLSVYFYRQLQTIGAVTGRSSFAPMQTMDQYSISARAAPPAPPPPGSPPSFDKLRTDFRDTAYWSPSIVTGADGNAIVTFTWPDSLTSFTASGIGVTEQSDVGRGTGTALVAKDFLVRLAAPRFLRRGDTATMTATAQGTPRAKTALLRFSAPALGVADDTVPARFDAHASANARWNVRGAELGEASLRLAGTSGTLRDGLRVAIPVETAGSAVHDRGAGALPSSESAKLVLPRGSEAGDLRIDLAPSALAQLAAGVRLLQIYPYSCVEQTMSAALPAIYLERMRKRMSLPAPDGPAPEQVAKKAVDRLVQLQHSDGSWGWWEHDAANPFMTAYALYGLAELARDGYAVPASTIDDGASSLARQIGQSGNTLGLWGGEQPNSEWNTRAFMLFALADARPKLVDAKVVAAADAQAKELNTYALSALGLAHVELGDKAGAQPLLAELLRRVSDDGTYAQWKGPGWHYRWEDDPIETTAYALRFLHAMTPDDPRVQHVVNWLRVEQHGSWFATTKDTAAAIDAMSEAIPPAPNELDPHETVRVLLDGHVVRTVRIDKPVLSASDASVTIPARLLRNGGTVRFAREGTGGLWWSTDWTRYVAHPSGPQLDPSFAVVRTYSSQNGNDWRVGDQIDVDLTVTASEAAQYVAIEDPLPAGLEYQPRQYESGDDWSGLQFFDDRVVFFATRIGSYSPVRLHYTLRATTPGAFTAPAPTVFAMYGPPATATGTRATITIRR